jgi:hypothetical protein
MFVYPNKIYKNKKRKKPGAGGSRCNPSFSEAEIMRIAVRSQAWQSVRETLSQRYTTQKGLVKWLKV